MNPLPLHRILSISCLAMLFCLYGVWAWPALPKLISDVTVTSQNSDDITDTAYDNYYYCLKINDTASYSPDIVFTNTGNMSLLNYNETGTLKLQVVSNTNSTVTLRNYGRIDLSYPSTNRIYRTHGIHAAGRLENFGSVTLTSIRPTNTFLSNTYGIRAEGMTMANYGDIRIDVTGGNTYGFALGVGVEFTGNTMTNSGEIVINAIGNTAIVSGFGSGRAKGIYTQGNLVNTGRITLLAVAGVDVPNNESEDSSAYGIETDGNLELDSRGVIQVEARQAPGYTGGTQEAYQVRVTSGTTTITGYAMELAPQIDFTATYGGAIGVAGGGAVAFSDAVLHLSIPDQFSAEEIYEVPMLVEGAAVADQFVRLGPLPPEYKAELVDGEGLALQQIQFFFGPEDSVALMGTQVQNTFDSQVHGMVGDQALTPILFDLLPTETLSPKGIQMPDTVQGFLSSLEGPVATLVRPGDGPSTLFAGPMLLKSDRDHGTRGYTAERYGFLAGITHELWKDQLYVGAHVGSSQTDVDYTGAGFEHRFDRTQGHMVGGHGLWHREDWLVSGMASLFFSDTDYADHSPDNNERASYGSLSFRGEVSLGQMITLGRHHLIPEAGFSFLWTRREAFTTENLDNPDVTHGALEAWDLYGKLGLRYLTHLRLDSGLDIRPQAGVSLTRVLTDGDYTSTLTASNIPRTVVDGVDRTTAALDLSVSTDVAPFEITAGYSMTLSEETENHFFWLRMGIAF